MTEKSDEHKTTHTSEANLHRLLKEETTYLVVAIIALQAIIKIAFYKESLTNILSFTASLFFIYLLPGIIILFIWRNQLSFLERLLIGAAAGLGIVSTISYLLDLIGIDLAYHIFITFPIILITVSIVIYRQEKKSKTNPDRRNEP